MIRVLQIYDSIAVSSGISSVIMSWFNNIKLNDDVYIEFLCSWRKDPSYENIIIEKGSKVWYIEQNNHINNYFEFIKKTKDFFKKHATNYDIVHLHSATFSFPYLFYAKKYGIKVRIMHVHSATLGNTYLSSLRNRLLFQPMKGLASDYWACSNEAALEWYTKNGIDNFFVIKNGINTELYCKNESIREIIRKSLDIKESEYVIGHVSNMTPIKNIPFLLKVFSEIHKLYPKVKLLLVGKDKLDDDVCNLITQLGVNDYVVNAGVRSDIADVIQAFDIGLMPSISEGYGLVPVELQAASIPVIMSIGFPSVVCFSEQAYRLDFDVEQWVNTTLSILFDNNEKKVSDKESLLEYDISIISRKVVQQYRKLLGAK